MHDPARPRRLVACLARSGLCAGAFLVAAALARGSAPPAGGSRDEARDLQVMVHARRALREDPALANLNFGVRVRDGVATLWGPVPSADVIPKALKTLESVRGVLGVATELYVRVPEKPDDQLLIPLTPPEPTHTESASPDPESGLVKTLTGRPAKSGPVPAQVTERGTSPSGVELHAPVSVPVSDGAAPATSAVPGATRVASALPDDVTVAVERLRRGSPRYRKLRVEVRGSAVTVSGTAEQGDEVMALARAISVVPGVGRVLTRTDDPAH
jgi:osmotically-inducible protein OsmY